MVALGAPVLNIGTLSPHWVEAMLAAAKARTGAASRSCSTLSAPARPATARETARRILDATEVAVLRGNPGEIATLVGAEAEVRGVELIDAGGDPAELARGRRRTLGVVASVTGAVDYASDDRHASRSRTARAALPDHGDGPHVDDRTGCFLAVRPDAAGGGGRGARRLRCRRRGRCARGGRSRQLPRRPRDALAAPDPATIDTRAKVEELVRA